MKKLFAVVLAVLVVGTLAPDVQAGPPLDGIYQSSDLGGTLDLGRYTESWMMAGGNLALGNIFDASSWDGANLGTQWRYYCGTLTNVQLLSSTVDANGNGNETYMKTFTGGFIWLSGGGPWANGDPDYPGSIVSYIEFETITYQNFNRVAAVSNVQASAQFDNYPDACINFAIGNMAEMGSTDTMMKPMGYPGFLDMNCDDTRMVGGWWDMFTLTLTITGCSVDTEDHSWGSVKSLYK